jgi:hypothetical protein
MKLFMLHLLLVFALSNSAVCLAQTKKALTNQDIVDMTKAGLGEATIAKAIETNETNFDTDPQTLITLKNSGVNDGVLTAMLSGKKPKPQSADTANLPAELGLYLWKDGAPIEVGAEMVNYRTGGAAEKFLTGADKGYTNGVVNGPHSVTQASPPLEFIMVTPDGITPSEYLLVKLDEKSDRREFREETSHMYGKSNGLGRNAVQFEFRHLAPRTYRINIGNLAQGEYGFLPPAGLANRNAQASGRIFAFSVN